MLITYDLHTHTRFSHGKGSVMDNAEAAARVGLKGIAVTDHGFGHKTYAVRREEMPTLRKEAEEAEKKTGIKVLVGVEANVLGEGGECDVTTGDYGKLDIFLVGVHRLVGYASSRDFRKLFLQTYLTSAFRFRPSKSLIDYTTKAYISVVEKNPVDVLTHINYLCFSRARDVAACCADNGVYLEINTKKTHLTDEEWNEVLKTDVRFVVDSDAHSPERVGDTALAEDLFSRVPDLRARVVNAGDKLPSLRFSEYKKRHM